jgi:hypothetical protein
LGVSSCLAVWIFRGSKAFPGAGSVSIVNSVNVFVLTSCNVGMSSLVSTSIRKFLFYTEECVFFLRLGTEDMC